VYTDYAERAGEGKNEIKKEVYGKWIFIQIRHVEEAIRRKVGGV